MPLYRQITHKLRLQGRDPETSERPRETKPPYCYHDEPCRYTDHKHQTDLAPTVVELRPGDPVDFLLRTGAVVPWKEPRRKATSPSSSAAAEEEVSGGEAG